MRDASKEFYSQKLVMGLLLLQSYGFHRKKNNQGSLFSKKRKKIKRNQLYIN
jgi:hypothetical protein